MCKEDFFGEQLPCYTFTNLCHEKEGLELGDQTKKIIFNASNFEKEEDLEKKSILKYIKSKETTTEFTTRIDTIVETVKQNEVFRGEYMAWGLAEQDAEKRGYKAGIEEGALQKALETARNFIDLNIPYEQIAQGTGLPLETVKELAKEIK